MIMIWIQMSGKSNREGNGKKTTVAHVYRLIRDDIINGVYPFGTHLVRRVIAEKYGVSVMPVMEAFYKLEADGLVENSPLVGTHVIGMNAEDIDGDAILREAIECQAARMFTVNATLREREQITQLAGFLDELTEIGLKDNPTAHRLFQKTHSEFHLAIAKLSGAKQLYQLMQKIWYRRLMLVAVVNNTIFPPVKNWHGMLVASLVSGDPEEADRAMRKHVKFLTDKSHNSVEEILRRGKRELMEFMMAGKETGDADESLED